MSLPFTPEQFLGVFAAYNRAVWPMQLVLLVLAAAVLYLASAHRLAAGRTISLILALLWMWMGIVYHLMFFTTINKAAYVFGGLTIAQGLIFLYQGVIRRELGFRWRPDAWGVTGTVIVLYALVIYPILGAASGHMYPQSPTFGLPCPTTIFTFGIMLMSERKISFGTLAIPLAWSLLGFTAALSLGIREDIGLLAAGVITAVMAVLKNRALDAQTARQAA